MEITRFADSNGITVKLTEVKLLAIMYGLRRLEELEGLTTLGKEVAQAIERFMFANPRETK